MLPKADTEANRRQSFEALRERLWGISYRMLGSRADAEDMLQEAYLRWHRADFVEIRSPEAWLVTTVTRLCLDRLRALRAERRAYVGPWLPEPLVAEAVPTDRASELASDLSVAFLALLERLAPEERAAFLLHEVFESNYGDIASILGKSEPACRQIVSRAKKRVKSESPRVHVSTEAHEQLLGGFVEALRAGSQESMLRLFAEHAAWTSDGGGKANAARKVVQGRQRVALFATKLARRFADRSSFRQIEVNGQLGVAWLLDGRLLSILALRTDGQHVLDVYSILNPDKLRGIALD